MERLDDILCLSNQFHNVQSARSISVSFSFVLAVEEPSEVPGHSVGDLDAKTEVGRNLGLRATEK